MTSRLAPVRRLLVLLVLAAVAALPATAGAATFPETIRLPDGWQPEGIAGGRGTSLYVGSIPTGAVWKGDARTGRDLASYQLAPAGVPTFVNDVVVTRKGAFFTDSLNQRLYVVPLGRHGRLPGQAAVRTLPLTGDLRYQTGINLNGIDAAWGGRVLVVVQTNTGKLFTVSPRTGRTREIDLGGATVVNGDGLLLRGRTLFVVRNRDNLIVVVRLSRSLTRGRVVAELTDPDLDVPTTLAFTAGRLYTVNARFGVEHPETARYAIVRVG